MNNKRDRGDELADLSAKRQSLNTGEETELFYDESSSSEESDIEDIDWEDIDLTGDITVKLKAPLHQNATNKRRRKDKFYHRLRYGLHIIAIPILVATLIKRTNWTQDERLRRRLKRSIPKQITKKIKNWSKSSQDIRISSIRTLLLGLVMWFRANYQINSNGFRQNFYRLHYIFRLDDGNVMKPYREACLRDQHKYYGERPDIAGNIEDIRTFVRNKKANRDYLTLFFITILREILPADQIKSLRLCFSLPLHNFQISPRNITKLASRDAGKVPNRFDTDLLQPYFWIELHTIDEPDKLYVIDPVVHIEEGNIVKKYNIDEPVDIFEPIKDLNLNVNQWFQYVISCDVKDMTIRDVSARYIPDIYYRYYDRTRGSVLETTRQSKSHHFFMRVLKSTSRYRNDNTVLMKTIAAKNYKLPKSISELKRSPNFKGLRILKQSETVSSKAKPVGKVQYGGKKDKIYRISDILPLKTRQHWYLLGRTVKEDAKPIRTKTIPLRKRNAISSAQELNFARELFSYEQTDLTPKYPSSYKDVYGRYHVVCDVDFYKNKYKNVEIYSKSVIPTGFRLMRTFDKDYKFDLRRLIKNANVERGRKGQKLIKYLDVVSGFDFRKGQATPIKTHILVNYMDYRKILSLQKDYIELLRLESWSNFITRLKIKCELEDKYGKL